MNFPLPLETLVGKPLMYLIFGIIGFGFGYALEISGFGDSRKLAAQFYFKELTVLKVMFTAIVVAMVLIFAMVGLGILDYNQIWVNPTYMWPGIVGGLIMGVGFIVGGFCPGTSLVSAATFKLDGIFFVLGGLAGIFLFGETVPFYEEWWNSSNLGRLTIQDWLNLPTGIVVLLIVLMALFMFWGSEKLEQHFGKRDLAKEPRFRIVGAATLVLMAVAVVLIGTPSTEEKWARIELQKEAALVAREVQIHPGELLATIGNNRMQVDVLDVRPEGEFNLFHIEGSQHLELGRLVDYSKQLVAQSAANKVYMLVSNDETLSTQAWKTLVAEGVPNVYILEGGINNWLSLFAQNDQEIVPLMTPVNDDSLRFSFPAALGSRYEAAAPSPHEWEFEYEPKIKLEIKRDKSGGGCG